MYFWSLLHPVGLRAFSMEPLCTLSSLWVVVVLLDSKKVREIPPGNLALHRSCWKRAQGFPAQDWATPRQCRAIVISPELCELITAIEEKGFRSPHRALRLTAVPSIYRPGDGPCEPVLMSTTEARPCVSLGYNPQGRGN